jgi:hypothetical protein
MIIKEVNAGIAAIERRKTCVPQEFFQEFSQGAPLFVFFVVTEFR